MVAVIYSALAGANIALAAWQVGRENWAWVAWDAGLAVYCVIRATRGRA